MRINVGCGQTPTDGWVNFDNSIAIKLAQWPVVAGLLFRVSMINQRQKEFIDFASKASIGYADAVKGLPVPTSSVSVFYSSHVLEHLDRVDASLFLREAYRVLLPGGVIRLAVPDIKKQVARYSVDQDADAFVASTLMCIPRPRGVKNRMLALMVGPRNHQWAYDGASLSRLLENNGFLDATELPVGHTTIKDPGALDLYERSEESVYVEARKVD